MEANDAFARVETPHLLRRMDANCEVEAVSSYRVTESTRSSIPAVAEHDVAWYSVLDGSREHHQREVLFRLELDLLRNVTLLAERRAARPSLR